ncbi:S-layer homology domain-containing protein, partial [Paenibacillus septentrionalis]
KTLLKAKADEIDEAIEAGELKEEAYTEASWQALEEALTEAKKVLADEDATQEEVDAALEALENAHEKLVPAPVVPSVDKTLLKAKADEIDETIEAGELKEEAYTADSWQALEEALTEAKKVLADEDATQEEVDAAREALENAHEKLVPAPVVPNVDKTLLKAKADEIDEAIEAAELKGADYTEASWQALEEALTEAKKVLADEDATQEQVNEALAALEKAHKELVEVEEPTAPAVDKTALQAKAEAIDEAIEAGTLKGADYTADSWKALQAAQAAAKAVLADANATQAEVDSALAALSDAYAKLVKAPTSPGNGGGTVPTPAPTPTPTPESPIISTADGSKVPFASASTVQTGDRSQITIKVERDKLSELLNEGTGQKLGIQVPGSGDVDVQGLTVEDLKKLIDTGSSLDIEDLLAIYPVPADQLKLDEIVSQFGNTPLSEIEVNIKIKRSSEALANLATEQVAAKGYELLVHPVEIDLTFTHDGQTNQADLLAGYAVKYIALPEGIDPNRITTGVVIKPDGTVLHVPTVVTKFNNRYFALINDLRSYGTYSVIWNPRDLNDVKTHWAKDSVNNMAARLVIEGTGNNNFTPDRVITRSEFAVFIVRGLGLMHLDVEQNKFHDVSTAIWFHDAVTIANDFGIVLGYNDGAFRGDLEITREQGMAMIYRSFQLINPEASMSEDQINSVLSTYDDAHKIAPWAKEAIAMLISQGITEGKNEQLLDPKGEMTRAEAAALIQRLLKATQLID